MTVLVFDDSTEIYREVPAGTATWDVLVPEVVVIGVCNGRIVSFVVLI
jgi:hypothetical protein